MKHTIYLDVGGGWRGDGKILQKRVVRNVADWNSTASTLIAPTPFGRGVMIILSSGAANSCARLTISVYFERT